MVRERRYDRPLLGGCDRWHRDRIPMGKRQIWDRGERGIEAGTKPSGRIRAGQQGGKVWRLLL